MVQRCVPFIRRLMPTLSRKGGRLAARVAVVTGALSLVLSACVLDDEAAVRSQLAQWVALGDTTYFRSQKECTAALFHTKARAVKSRISKARSIRHALRVIDKGQAVAFRVKGMTPTEVHKQLDLANRKAGIAMLTSGLGGRNCMTPEMKNEFAAALRGEGVIVLYDPNNHAFALFERASKRVFYTRGDVG